MSAVETFSTRSIPQGQQAEFWDRVAAAIFPGMSVDVRRKRFDASISRWSLGAVHLARAAPIDRPSREAAAMTPARVPGAASWYICSNAASAQFIGCGARGTSLNPDLLLQGLGGVNADSNPLNDRLPWDDRYVLADQDKSYATGNSFSELENWGVAATMDYDLTDQVMLRRTFGLPDS